MVRYQTETFVRVPHCEGKPLSANLAGLALGSLSLTPVFDSGVYSYTANTTNATNTINATPEDSSAAVNITVDSVPVANGTAATWNMGVNTVVVTVTNGSAIRTYTVSVDKT